MIIPFDRLSVRGVDLTYVDVDWIERMNESIMNDLRFYIDLYVDQGFTYDEAERLAKNLMRCIGILFDEKET